jgi:hypothetical protein
MRVITTVVPPPTMRCPMKPRLVLCVAVTSSFLLQSVAAAE